MVDWAAACVREWVRMVDGTRHGCGCRAEGADRDGDKVVSHECLLHATNWKRANDYTPGLSLEPGLDRPAGVQQLHSGS